MTRQQIVYLGSQNLDGSLTYPGPWVEIYVRMIGDVWILASREPYREFGK